MLALLSTDAGGLRVIVAPDTDTGTAAECAAVPGAAAEEPAGSPVCAFTTVPSRVVVAMPAGGGVESQASGALAVNTGTACGLGAACRFPPLSAVMARPGAVTVSLREASAGLAAAAAFLMMKTSENAPWVVAVTARSTPGSTSA